MSRSSMTGMLRDLKQMIAGNPTKSRVVAAIKKLSVVMRQETSLHLTNGTLIALLMSSWFSLLGSLAIWRLCTAAMVSVLALRSFLIQKT
jgi:hypothetical protein